jgi:hypothetical protein
LSTCAFPRLIASIDRRGLAGGAPARDKGVNAFAWKSQWRSLENPRRKAALQIRLARPDNLAAWTSSGASVSMLCLICSL